MSEDQRDPDLDAVHDRAMRRMDAAWDAAREDRALALADRRFAMIRGAQWEGQGAPVDPDSEDGDGPARMEVPKYLRPIRRVQGDYRAARKSVDFRPKGDSDRNSADNLDGLYRSDENDSRGGGQHAYDNGFQEGIHGGMGGWMLRAEYEDEEDEENEYQRIRIEPVYDADQSMFFDVNAKAQDKSDAKHAFLLFTMTREAFEAEYPNATPSTFSDKLPWNYDWVGPDTITLATYYEVEDQSVVRVTMRQTILDDIPLPEDAEPDEQVFDEDALSEEMESGLTRRSELRAKGYRQVKRRRIKRQRVHKYLLSGAEVLEDEGLIAGQNIPLIPFYAERAYVDGIERSRGMIRPVRDAVIINNLVVSNLAESASGPTNKTPIFAPEQMDGGIGTQWATYKVDRPAFLLARPLYNEEGSAVIAAGPSAWVEPDQIQPATGALLTVMGGTIDELMGFVPEAERVPANTSAQAIELVNDRGDANDFLWHDNFALALQRTGEVWLGMARELYVEQGRTMVALDMEGKQSTITIAEPKHDEQSQYLANDLSTGRYDVIVDVGPATKTRRDAVAKSMINLADSYQQIGNTDNANAALGIAVLSMDGEGVDGFRNAVRQQLVTGGWVEPNEEEKAKLAAAEENQQPDPNTVIAQAAMVTAQAELKTADTKAMEAEARYVTAQANLRIAEAKAAAMLAQVDQGERKLILDEVQAATDSDREDARLDLEYVRSEVDSDRADERQEHDIRQAQKEPTDGAAA